MQGHDQLFQGGVSGALANAVDGALDLARTGFDGGQRVGYSHAEIVMAVGGDDVGFRPSRVWRILRIRRPYSSGMV